jgi:hypothetical protein
MSGLMAAVLLLAEPQLSVHGGASVGFIHVGAQQFGDSKPNGLNLSLEGQAEYGHFFFGASAVFGQGVTTSEQLAPAVVSGKFGLFLLNDPIAPYVAVGAGWLRELLADGDLPPNPIRVSGAALLAEVGVEGSRSWTAGRLIVYLQFLKPVFEDPHSSIHSSPTTGTCWLGGVRLLL